MSKYIKVRELENLKCYLDDLVNTAEKMKIADKDIYYKGKAAAYEDISGIIDEILEGIEHE